MTYKDCLHYEVCCYWLNKEKKHLNCDDGFICDNFTNRSQWVHLPCKVGDKVWYITGIGHNLIKPAIVNEIIIDGKGIKDLYVCGNGHNFENSFDIFHLTREEAEKALEEKK